MIRKMRSKVTYANVVATSALFIALGGTSYAALKLPRNSVGAAQIRDSAVGRTELRSGSVTSRAIRNGSVGIADISSRGKENLRGRQGPIGPQGATGAAGASNLVLTAAVDSNSLKVRGSGSRANRAAGTNLYTVEFPRNVDQCVATATLATVEGGGDPTVPPAGRITVAHAGGNVIVRTFDAAGDPTALPFNVLVAC